MELDLQAVLNHLTWLLETEFGFFAVPKALFSLTLHSPVVLQERANLFNCQCRWGSRPHISCDVECPLDGSNTPAFQTQGPAPSCGFYHLWLLGGLGCGKKRDTTILSGGKSWRSSRKFVIWAETKNIILRRDWRHLNSNHFDVNFDSMIKTCRRWCLCFSFFLIQEI